jgi:hypothetical protein
VEVEPVEAHRLTAHPDRLVVFGDGHAVRVAGQSIEEPRPPDPQTALTQSTRVDEIVHMCGLRDTLARMKRTASKKVAKKVGAIAARAESAAARRARELLELVARRMQRITEDFYDIGTALRELHEKKLFAALGFASLGDLLKAHRLMSRSRAFELIHIVRTVPRKEALTLGAERSYALARLTAATKAFDTVEELADEGVVVGGRRRKVEDVPIRELEKKVQEERRKNKPARIDAAAAEATNTAKTVQAALRKRGARKASVQPKKRAGAWYLVVEVPLAAASALTG